MLISAKVLTCNFRMFMYGHGQIKRKVNNCILEVLGTMHCSKEEMLDFPELLPENNVEVE